MKYLAARSARPLALALGVLSLFACRPDVPRPGRTPPAADARCVDWQWVAVKPGGASCPEARGWTETQLFADANGAPPPAALADYCLYRHDGGGDLEDDVQRLLGLVDYGRLRSASRDCRAVVPAGPFTDATCPSFHQEFLDRAGWVDGIDYQEPSVRLAILDTLPTSEEPIAVLKDLPSKSRHGNALAYLAEALACDTGGDCAAKITSQLALPCSGESCDEDPLGGYYGMVTDLAVAIRSEVAAWQANTPELRQLVLNLSLGWDAGLVPSETAEPVRAAIENAVCDGSARNQVLVVAAAGNPAGGDPQPDGPLLPAGWENQQAPCAAAGVYDPLVHAVGALRFDGNPLAMSRPGGRPRLVAYADHWAAETPPDDPTVALTGTSTATAVVSAIAAAVWESSPGLPPHEVMRRIYEAGPPAGGPAAAFGLVQAQTVRRASLCHALDSGTCPPELPKTTLDVEGGLALQLDQTSAKPALGGGSPPPPCTAAKLYHQSPMQDYLPCPFEQLDSAIKTPYTWPHPGEDPCPTCGMFPDGGGLVASYTLWIEIAGDFEGTVSSPTLTIGDTSYALALQPMSKNQTAEVSGFLIDNLAETDRLDLTWVVTQGNTQKSAISYLAMLSKHP